MKIEAIKKEGMETVVKDRFSRTFSPGFVERNPETAERYKVILLQNDPEGYLRVMQRMGHPTALEQPQEYNETVLRFLAEVGLG